MRFWLASFGILFALAELCQWVKEFTLPFPLYVFAGAALAFASNYDKGMFPWWSQEQGKTLSTQPEQEVFSPLSSISFKIDREL